MLNTANPPSFSSGSLLLPDISLTPSPTRQDSIGMSNSERQPLLAPSSAKKPFYRPRPMWLVPFVTIAALVRGLTLAPRVEVYTQLSCHAAQHKHYNHTANIPSHTSQRLYEHLYHSLDPLGPTLPLQPNHSYSIIFSDYPQDPNDGDPRYIPSHRCLSDPVVQANAARLSAVMMITMGGLSAFTTGWWGRFGERHGRTRVLAIATLGLLLSDLIFILVSTPHSPFASHGHKFLIFSPLLEGLLGGWSTLQGAVSAYISDCTSPGSRSQIFSRFTGVIALGLAFGPSLAAFLIQHPVLGMTKNTVTEVFWVAVACSFLNMVLVLFVFPESLSQEKQIKARREYSEAWSLADEPERVDTAEGVVKTHIGGGIAHGFLSSLALFLPVAGGVSGGKDWSLTFLACALWGYMLSTGIIQIRYLYAGHIYGWGAEQLSYFISFLNGCRALHLLLLLPFLITTFKPIPKFTKLKSKLTTYATTADAATAKSAKVPTRAHLGREMHFDIRVTQYSLLAEIVSNLLVVVGPLSFPPTLQNPGSQTFFVLASSLACIGSGTIPAMQSLSLCIMQARALREGAGRGMEVDLGRLFGALAVLQAVGQMILGPMLFGLVYSETVARYPKAIFVTAMGILVGSLAVLSLVRVERVVGKGKRKMQRWEREELERGRSRASKDLRRGNAEAGPSR